MKRKLTKQIANEWRNNFWLVVELTVVGTVLWYAVNILWTIGSAWLVPTGYDISDTYSISYNCVGELSDDYAVQGEGEAARRVRDFEALVDRVRQTPGVLAVGMGYNAAPYNFNFYGSNLSTCDPGDTIAIGVNRRTMTTDMIKVWGIKGKNGETSEQLIEMLQRGEVLVGLPNGDNRPADNSLRGRYISLYGDTIHRYRVGAEIQNIRRNDFEATGAGTLITPITVSEWIGEHGSETLWVRCRPGMGREFLEHMREKAETDYAVGPYYVTDVQSVEVIRKSAQAIYTQQVLISVVSVLFLTVSIFLGLLGTFWFRTQQRTSEIAIRKVNGATNGSIFRRLINEGMLLMAMAVPFMALLEWLIVSNDLFANLLSAGTVVTHTLGSILGCSAITIALLMLMIFLGILFPARKAMRVNPAIALKDE